MNYNIEDFEHKSGLNLKWERKDGDAVTEVSFEYGNIVITETVPEDSLTVKDGKVSVPVRLNRNQIKSIIDIYAKLYEPRIEGWTN